MLRRIMSEVAILVGLQGSGKSTFVQRSMLETHALVSKDLLRNNRNPSRRQLQLVAAALDAGRSVVLDNTNASRAQRAEVIALARSRGARVVGYWFDTDLEGCRARNARREGRARVPDVALHVTARILERPTPAEGFDALYRVRLVEPEGFDVQPL
jgi:predicted kinase